MILSRKEQEYIEAVDRTILRAVDDTETAKGTPEDLGVVILGLIAKQQAETNALLLHLINFLEGKVPDGGEDGR